MEIRNVDMNIDKPLGELLKEHIGDSKVINWYAQVERDVPGNEKGSCIGTKNIYWLLTDDTLLKLEKTPKLVDGYVQWDVVISGFRLSQVLKIDKEYDVLVNGRRSKAHLQKATIRFTDGSEIELVKPNQDFTERDYFVSLVSQLKA